MLTEFVETYPDYREGHFRLAMTLVAQDRLENAGSHLETAVSDDNFESSTFSERPVPRSHLELAKILTQLGEKVLAVYHNEKVLAYTDVDTSHQEAKEALAARQFTRGSYPNFASVFAARPQRSVAAWLFEQKAPLASPRGRSRRRSGGHKRPLVGDSGYGY